ncbi:MAG: NBR1-Ig-like domain-containing protein [Anaerolineaceae bacterium]
MNKAGSICTIIFLLLLASACSSAAKSTEPSTADIYTAVVITLTAQAGEFTPTETAQLVPSSSATVTETELPAFSFTPEAISTNSAVPPTQPPVNVVPSSSSSECNNSIYMSDVTIPDGTILAPGQAFVKTWQFQNTGTCAWSSNYQIIFINGNAMSGSESQIAQTVYSGNNANITVSLIAPDSVGTYTGYWRLADANGNVFGTSVYVQIKVSSDANTLTPTPTSTEDTSTPTDTPEASDSTATSISTATTTRTSTLTRTPSSTPTPKPSSTSRPTQSPTSTFTPVPTEALTSTIPPASTGAPTVTLTQSFTK